MNSLEASIRNTKSRGEVTLESADPFADPLIDPKFLSHPDDMKDMIDGYKMMMRVLGTEPFSKYISDHTMRPIDINDDSDIEQAMREEADTVYHPVGTCKMGDDEMSVVDSRLKVHNLSLIHI